MWDLIIANSKICDGSGRDIYTADIAIQGERIAAIGSLLGKAKATIDASGLVVTPGLIDAHSHADCLLTLPAEKQAECLRGKLYQGVSTIIIGNCGLGIAPCLTEQVATQLTALNAWMAPEGFAVTPKTFDTFLQTIQNAEPPLNVAALVAHGAIRASVLGLAARSATSSELDRMKGLLQDALQAGALGLSSGLIYPPGMYAPPDELQQLAKIIASSNKIYTSHIRGSSETLPQAVNELLELARTSGARVHHSHNEAVGRRYWPQINKTLATYERASDEGIRISFDVFPYPMAATMMTAIYPPWALEGGPQALLQRLKSNQQRQAIKEAIETTPSRWDSWKGRGWPHNLVKATGWESIYIGYVKRNKQFEGISISELASLTCKDPFDAISDLMLEEDATISMLIYEISGDETERSYLDALVEHPLSMICSDAEDYGRGLPHPAAYGAFARVLRRSRLSFEQAVHKMTARTAATFGIKDRGLISSGMYADIALFDQTNIEDTATVRNPRSLASGLKYLLINGQLTISNGEYRQIKGKVLRC